MGRALCFIASVMAFISTSVSAQVNSWINPASGNWDQTSNWSLGVPPGSSQSVMITNTGWKAVAIQPSTASNFPQALAVNSVTITSPTNGFNTLLLNFAGTGSPLVIGVDSNTPGSLVIGDSNSAVVMFSSGLTVNNALGTNNSHLGEFEVDGTFNESEGSQVTAGFLEVGGSGTYSITNSLLSAPGEFIFGHFNQQGGTNTGAVIFTDGGDYDLFDGMLNGSVEMDEPYAGVFRQWGGTNISSLGLGGPGVYQLSGGLLVPGDLEVGPPELSPSSFGAGAVVQTGGANNAGNITMGVGSYALQGGVLTASNLTLPTVSSRLGSFGSSFDQSGGYFRSGGISMNGVFDTRLGLQTATYRLSGGELETPTISMTMGLVNQTGGTNSAGVVTLDSVSSYVLNGGLLIVSNLTQNGQTAFSLVGSIQQSGGTNEVLGLLFVGGNSSYNFTNGLLIADNIHVTGQAIFLHAGGSFGGFDNILLAGGGWVEQTAGEQLGQLQLGSGTNSSVNLPSGSCVLRFADSSGVPWPGDGRLTIQNWSGSLTGGGSQQLSFGTSASGLTSQQLGQVQFSNPAGLPNGTYSARILSDGEVVPNQAISNSGVVNSWINPASGNWDDASSWSLGVLPDSSQSVLITNSGWKAVAINPSTPINFPGSMTVSSLAIQGATNTENTLLLNFFGTTVPLTVLNGLTLRDGAQILNFNSGLEVQGGTITVTNSQINQDGGFVGTTGAPMYLQNAVYNLTNGLFEGGQVLLGLPVRASFNQYGGTVVISNLVFGRNNTHGAGGTYALYGGNLNLPNGLTINGDNNASSFYFQAGGTNRTTTVSLEAGLFGVSPGFTLNDGLLADNDVNMLGDDFGGITIAQNGGTHTVSNALTIAGGAAATGGAPLPSAYQLNGGTLSARSIILAGQNGDAHFIQSNGLAQAELIQAGAPADWFYVTDLNLSGGTLTCSNLLSDNGVNNITQHGGVLVVSNTLGFSGYNQPFQRPSYSQYEFLGGTLNASNINVGGVWIIGDSSTNRINNPGTCSLSHTLVISNAVEQFGRFILASNALIDLAGSASRLSFANSSGESWTGGALLVVSNWNGNLSGGGAEQLKFGTNQSGLTPAELSQIQFNYSSNLYSAKILSTGEVVPDHVILPSVVFARQGNNLILTWPPGWSLQTATNVLGSYIDILGATSPYTNDMALEPQRFFRVRQ